MRKQLILLTTILSVTPLLNSKTSHKILNRKIAQEDNFSKIDKDVISNYYNYINQFDYILKIIVNPTDEINIKQIQFELTKLSDLKNKYFQKEKETYKFPDIPLTADEIIKLDTLQENFKEFIFSEATLINCKENLSVYDRYKAQMFNKDSKIDKFSQIFIIEQLIKKIEKICSKNQNFKRNTNESTSE